MNYDYDMDKIRRLEHQHYYISNMRPLFLRRALFADTSEEFISPAQPEKYDNITLRFRTARDNVDCVYIHFNGERFLMNKAESEGDFDYYTYRYKLGVGKFAYHFEIKAGNITCFYDQRGAVPEPDPHYDLVVIPGFKTPDWAKGAVMYQIYVDRFCNGDPDNDVQTGEYCYINEQVNRVEDWSRNPRAMDVRDFYGGDLQGVLDKMDYLEELGVEVIYFNPLFVSPSNHKYDSQDYDNIDPHLGKIVEDGGELLRPGDHDNAHATRYIKRVTDRKNLDASNELFAKVVEEAHRRGMRVIMDGVFNHCGSFNKWLDRERIYENSEGYEKGAYVSADSPYRDYFDFEKEQWPYNPHYVGWWGHNTLPKLNYEKSEELAQYVLNVARKWISPPYNADGWRLDVAADLGHSLSYNHKFWQRFRKAVKETNPEAIILAEHYGSTREWLQGNEWDTVMNYDAFMEPVTWFLTGMEKHSDHYSEDLYGNDEAFIDIMARNGANFTLESLQTAMNELSNHDHSRFMTRTNRLVGRVNTRGSEAAEIDVNKAVFCEGVVMQMTWVGAPTIYYGDEAGLCGFTDPDSRRTYPWGREDRKLIDFHRDLIHLRREHEELRTGSLKMVDSDRHFLCYLRFRKGEKCLILINNRPESLARDISVWEHGTGKEGGFRTIFASDAEGYSLSGETYKLEAGILKIVLPPTSAVILKYFE